MNKQLARPQAIGEARHGPFYSLAEVAHYRKAHGITQAELAVRLRMSRPYISLIEARAKDEAIQAKDVVRLLDGIEAIAEEREVMAAAGQKALAEHRASKAVASK